MAQTVSISARAALQDGQTDEVMVMLVIITHASLPAPVYLSSDPTVRISADPLAYGTRHQGEVYDFVLMGAVLPDDQDKSPPKTTLVFENVASGMAKAIRSILSPADVELRLVLASSPDVIEARYTRLRAVRGSYDASQVSLDISREPWTSEPMPAGRMTADRFPGLH
ncbi:hypothetical protein [Methylobacterium sp. WL6]|uniref:hypothetical protein n=1 Tax=Methylobacterium sp. WL6 TaxID=2603901 RepID=UPI0011CB52B6|nr:hypothetical protein [Methylobacterium sp. WL6]TXN64985.1 hypothetical protein FV230_17570 [Methylobacterium sp. WL6]